MTQEQMAQVQVGIDITEVYQIVGESQVLNFKLKQRISELMKQIDEMAKVITELRKKDEVNSGGLDQSNPGDSIRRFPGGVQGAGLGLGNHVPDSPDLPTDGIDQVGPDKR